jgi:hypothetical protein
MHVRTFVFVFAYLILPVVAAAQDGRLWLPLSSELRQKAAQSVDFTLGPFGLRLTSALLDDHDQDCVRLKKTLRGLKYVRIRDYQFSSSDWAYPSEQVDQLRRQLSEPDWSPLLQVHDRSKHQDMGIYISRDEHSARGVAIIASNPRELTIINIVGAVELNQIGALRDMFSLAARDYAQLLPTGP